MKQWKTALIQHFADGTTAWKDSKLGVEVEHFIVDPANGRQAVPYLGENGVREILKKLKARYPQAQALEDDDFFGFSVPEFNITLEPAAQLEISIASTVSVRESGLIYLGFRRNLDEILAEHGYEAVTAGGSPVSRVQDMTLIPKERYYLMNEHFLSTGTGGMEMMRGSASVQVSIDYSSEENFRRKFQAAYFYGPLFKILCDNLPVFQGEPVETHLKRTDIWRRVDPDRCGIVPDIFKPTYGYGDYADFLGAMPPIFLKEEGRVIPTGFKSVAEIFEDKEFTDEDLNHIISMAFPDVRLKQYIEIRVADSVPGPFMLAYTALIKGILYTDEGLDDAHEWITKCHFTTEDLEQIEDELMQHGWDGVIYGLPVTEAAAALLDIARRHLPDDEKDFLIPFDAVIRYGGIRNIPEEEILNLERKTKGKLL